MKSVDEINMLSCLGDNYINGEVVEGDSNEDDVARKGSVAVLVILPADVRTVIFRNICTSAEKHAKIKSGRVKSINQEP